MASETFKQTPGTVRDLCETVQQHPVYSHNQHALRLGVAATIVSSIAVMVLYPMPLSLQITLPVLTLGAVFLVVRRYVLPRVTTTAMLDMVVFSYQLSIFLVQWLCVWLSPDQEAVGGTACMIMMSGILYVSVWSFAAASYFCAGGWILARSMFDTVPPSNEILQLLIMAPTVSLLARRSLERTMDALRESRTREQRTVETLRSALADLKNETQRRQDSELQLAHAQKHQSLGLMAAGVAHDFNNTLLAISALSDIIASTSAESGVRKSAEDVSLAVQHASGICRQMLTYAGRSSSEQTSVNLNEILKNLQPLLQAT